MTTESRARQGICEPGKKGWVVRVEDALRPKIHHVIVRLRAHVMYSDECHIGALLKGGVGEANRFTTFWPVCQ